jgi:hypothetical protein
MGRGWCNGIVVLGAWLGEGLIARFLIARIGGQAWIYPRRTQDQQFGTSNSVVGNDYESARGWRRWERVADLDAERFPNDRSNIVRSDRALFR